MKFYNFNKSFAFVAQGIEHPPPKGRVARSNRAEGTILSDWLPVVAVRVSEGFHLQRGILRRLA